MSYMVIFLQNYTTNFQFCQFLCIQDDELERTKRSPRDRQYDDDIEYDMSEPMQMEHFKFMDGFEDPE